MHRYGWLVALLAGLAMTGCSREDADDTQGQEASSQATQGNGLPEDNVFSDQVKTLEKAEGVEQTLNDATAKRREEIENQEQR